MRRASGGGASADAVLKTTSAKPGLTFACPPKGMRGPATAGRSKTDTGARAAMLPVCEPATK